MSQKWEPTARTTASPIRQYTGQLSALDPLDRQFFEDRYEIPPALSSACIKLDPATQRYALPIFSPEQKERGIVLRQPWTGAPRVASGRRRSAAGIVDHYPKADTYKSTVEPLQSHYFAEKKCGCLVLVEDQLSAIKLSAYGFDSVALLGVPDVRYAGYSGADRVTEIARRAGWREVIIALDSDATETAFLFVRKWGATFNSIRVAMLDRDLKDTKASEFNKILGV